MVLRLLLGLLKGVVLGALVGFALVQLGQAAPSALVAYLAAAVTCALVGLIAGKPIWAAGARIEAGLKAGFGALLGVGLMWLTRSFLHFQLPFSLGPLSHGVAHGTIGGLAVTSLAVVAGVLGAFYDADNTPGDEEADASNAKPAAKARVAKPGKSAGPSLEEELALDDEEQNKKKTRN
ncbi:MAG: hypothetical protein U0271_18535 [Polyangiaceae bacterium]